MNGRKWLANNNEKNKKWQSLIVAFTLLSIGSGVSLIKSPTIHAQDVIGSVTSKKKQAALSTPKEVLNDIWNKNIQLVSTPLKADRNLPLFAETYGDDQFSTEQKQTVQGIQEIIKRTAYEDMMKLYYDDPADMYNDLSAENIYYWSIDKTHNTDPNFQYDQVQLKESYETIQQEAEQFAKHFVKAFPEVSQSGFEENKDAYLSTATYLHRWYTIRSEKSNQNLWEILYFKGNELFDDGISEWHADSLIQLSEKMTGTASQNYGEQLCLGIIHGKKIDSQFVTMTAKELNLYRNGQSVTYQTIIQAFVKKYEQTTDYDQWFKGYFGGLIYSDTSVPEEYQVSTWDKMNTVLLPYYLTVNNPQKLVLFNTMKYLVLTDAYNNPNYQTGLANASMIFNQYFQLFLRTMDDGKKFVDDFQESRVYDNGLNVDDKAEFTNPEDALDHSIYYPAGHLGPLSDIYANAITVQGSGNVSGQIVYTYYAKIDYFEQFTLAHELTHGLYNAFGWESSSELPTRFIEGGYGNLPAVNLYDITGSVGGGLANKSPLRFQSKQDFVAYNERYDQLMDVLNLALADAVLDLPANEQADYLGQAEFAEDGSGQLKSTAEGINYTGTPSINAVSEQEINKLQLSSYKDFVKKHLVVKPKEADQFSSDYTVDESQYFLYTESFRLFNKLFRQNGWEALKSFYTDNSQESLDRKLQIAYNDQSLTADKLLEQDLDDVADQLKKSDTVIGSYEEIKEAFKENMADFSSVKKEYIKKALAATNEFTSDIFTEKEAVPAEDLTVRYVDQDGKELHAPKIVKGMIGDSYDVMTPDFQLTIEGYALDKNQLPTNGQGTLSDKKQTVTYVYTKVQPDPSEGKLTINDYTVGDVTITGSYQGNVKMGRLTVNGQIISWGGSFSNGEFSYYCGAGKIKAGDQAILTVFDADGNQLAEMPLSITATSGDLTTQVYELGDSVISGQYTGNVKKAKLVVNGETVSWGGTFKDGQFSYYVNSQRIKKGDQVTLQPYDHYDSVLNTPKEVVIGDLVGQLTEAKREGNSTVITGTYNGDVHQGRLKVNGKVVSWGGTFKDGKFSYYVGQLKFNKSDQVILEGLNKRGEVILHSETSVTSA